MKFSGLVPSLSLASSTRILISLSFPVDGLPLEWQHGQRSTGVPVGGRHQQDLLFREWDLIIITMVTYVPGDSLSYSPVLLVQSMFSKWFHSFPNMADQIARSQ